MNCPYCYNRAEWVENKEIYGKNYGKSVMIYLCRPCNAYVGCHQNTRKPLGTMANRETREWRKKAHEMFDPLWRDGKMSRGKAYGLLQKEFGAVAHIGESDVENCKRIIGIVENYKEHQMSVKPL